MSCERITKTVKWIIALFILIVAVCLIFCCVAIYRSGERPFSRESIALYASYIALPCCLCLAAVIIGLFLPKENRKTPASLDEAAMLSRYQADLPEARKEQRYRKNCKWITAAITVALGVYPIVYFCDASHFSVSDINGDILRGTLVVMIPTAVALTAIYICRVLLSRSIRREIDAYKNNSVKPGKLPEKQNMESKTLMSLRLIVFTLGVMFIILGICNDGVADVLGKAIRICTECIGLG